MESQIVRRRVNMIAAHLAAHDDISAAATHLFPMCNLFSVGSCTESALPFKSNDCAKKTSGASEGPMFSRPTNKKFHFTAQGCKYHETAAEAPKFARPRTRTNEASHFQLKERRNGLESNGKQRRCFALIGVFFAGINNEVNGLLGWMLQNLEDVCRSIELPGVNISDIKVEVSDKSLIVSGSRSTQCKVASYLNDLVSAYHKKEIVQGPYRVFWPLPSNANKDRVSAEFV
ncbi:hypothetical protein HAX54_019723 [Datura stramonium]|uniref:SHSP domain-containing protein n=1 Tax=Datura stramonium TaxID=4076 RepID=A0ABS8US56_DATST|nr:hypothetical protein [Datura stramonium]